MLKVETTEQARFLTRTLGLKLGSYPPPPIPSGSFAEACYNRNTYDELVDGVVLNELNAIPADPLDCAAWGLSPLTWREEILVALQQALWDWWERKREEWSKTEQFS